MKLKINNKKSSKCNKSSVMCSMKKRRFSSKRSFIHVFSTGKPNHLVSILEWVLRETHLNTTLLT